MLSSPMNTVESCARRLAAVITFAVICWIAGTGAALAAPKQASFKSPEEAADALVAALKANDERRLVALFGPEEREAHRFRRCDRRSSRPCQVRSCLRRGTQDRNAGGRESGAQRRQGRVAAPGPDREAREYLALRREKGPERNRESSHRQERALHDPGVARDRRCSARVFLRGPRRRRPPRVCPALF